MIRSKILGLLSIFLALGAVVFTPSPVPSEATEAYPSAIAPKKADEDATEDEPFLGPDATFETDWNSLQGYNWMSGISGERRLNEINIPGTHDSAMHIASDLNESIGDIFGGTKYAVCQRESIYYQIIEGARLFDLRLNLRFPLITNRYLGWREFTFHNDGYNLWLCHGKDEAGGTFWSMENDYDDQNFRSLREELDTMIEFLRSSPTETIIIDLAAETVWSEDIPYIYKRLRKTLKEYSAMVNPSTDKPYIYWEDNEFGTPYTDYPKLSDVRGQIVVYGNSKAKNLGYGYGGLEDETMGGKYVHSSPNGSFHDYPEQRSAYIGEFFKNNVVSLPTNATSSLGFLFTFGTNCAPNNSIGIPADTPGTWAAVMNPFLFAHTDIVKRPGIYLGWLRMDMGEESYFTQYWRTNFFDGIERCTVTAKSGLSDHPDQSFTVLKGQTITLPYLIYDYDQGAHSNYFLGWHIQNGQTDRDTWAYAKHQIDEDTVFTARWGDEVRYRVALEWIDGENRDGIRPGGIDVLVNGESVHPIVNEYGDYLIFVEDWVTSVVPLFERVHVTSEHPYGEDTAGQYRYQITNDTEERRFTLTFIHTPDIPFSGDGTVRFDDRGSGASHPGSVEVRLLRNQATIAGPVTCNASNGWSYSFGTYAQFVDGVEQNIELQATPVGGYYSFNDVQGIKYVYIGEEQNVGGTLTWLDSGNVARTRPELAIIWMISYREALWKTLCFGNEGDVVPWDMPIEQKIRNGQTFKLVPTFQGELGYRLVQDPENGMNFFAIKDGHGTAEGVIALIDAIGGVEYTSACHVLIREARGAYDELDAATQAQVTNLDVLTKAESDYAALDEATGWAASVMAADCAQMKDAWSDLSNSFAALSPAAQAILKQREHISTYVEPENTIDAALQRYDLVMELYGSGSYEDFLSREGMADIAPSGGSGSSAFFYATNKTATPSIFILLLLALGATGVFMLVFFVTKRKNKNPL